MNYHRADDELSHLTRFLNQTASDIERSCCLTSVNLGEGLGIFEESRQNFEDSNNSLREALASRIDNTLHGLIEELRNVKVGLNQETKVLQTLSSQGIGASCALQNLLSRTLPLIYLARTARVEMVSLHSVERDFDVFADEMVQLAIKVQSNIQNFAHDYGCLIKLIASTLETQREFKRRYGDTLSALAAKLSRTLIEITDRRQNSIALSGQAAVCAGNVTKAASAAIVALQSGDRTCQKLWHVVDALGLKFTGGVGEGAASSDTEVQPAFEALLRRLQAAQLRECARNLSEDARSIETSLNLVAAETEHLLGLARALHKGNGIRSRSFLADIRADLSDAYELFGKCYRARSSVDEVKSSLSQMLATCQTTITALGEAVSTILLIGMNAGLRAAPLGKRGRSLGVIANELEIIVERIKLDASELTASFDQMNQIAGELRAEGQLDASNFTTLNDAMGLSLAALRETSDRFSAMVERLVREGGGFAPLVARARVAFSDVQNKSNQLANRAEILDCSVDERLLTSNLMLTKAAAGLIQRQLAPRYTMVEERAIHRRILASVQSDDVIETPAAITGDPTDQVEDFLFMA